MRYLSQFLLIAFFYYTGELLNVLLPLPVPAAVYGLLLLFAALCTGVVPLSWVEETADYLLGVLSVMFIPPAVGIINLFGLLASSWWKIVLICVATTFSTIFITGHAAQRLIRLQSGRK